MKNVIWHFRGHPAIRLKGMRLAQFFYDGQKIVITICDIFDLLRLFAYHIVPFIYSIILKNTCCSILVIANFGPFRHQ